MSGLPSGFFSYAHNDDRHDNGRLTRLQKRLEGEFKLQYGKPIQIFHDEKILCGENWREKIDSHIEKSDFLISVISPSYFESEFCNYEIEKFYKTKKEEEKECFIFPIYYIDSDVFDDSIESCYSVAHNIIIKKEYADWRKLRFKNENSQKYNREISDFTSNIRNFIKKRGVITKIQEKTDINTIGGSTPIERIIADQTGVEHVTEGMSFNDTLIGRALSIYRGLSPIHQALIGSESLKTDSLSGAAPAERSKNQDTSSVTNAKNLHKVDLEEEARQIEKSRNRIIKEAIIEEANKNSENRQLNKAKTAPVVRRNYVIVGKSANADFSSIGMACQRVPEGGHIKIDRGVYNESVKLSKNITIESDRNCKIISKYGPVFYSEYGSSLQNVTIKGVSIAKDINSTEESPCIDVHSATFLIEDVLIDGGSPGIFVGDGGAVIVKNTSIYKCKKSGIHVSFGGRADVRSSTISQIAGYGVETGGDSDRRTAASESLARDISAHFFNNKIIGCSKSGVFIKFFSQGNFTSNEISDNTESGVVIIGSSYPIFVNNRIANNLQYGVKVEIGGRANYSNNRFSNNKMGKFSPDESRRLFNPFKK
jgi:parallel beta-helix repeat protein